jgi:general stress protein 26
MRPALINEETIMTNDSKVKAMEFLAKNKISTLCTVDNNCPFARVMYTPKVDDDFTVWYSTSGKSNKIRHIKANPKVSVMFSEGWVYLQVIGNAEVVTDRETKASLWQEEWTRYWPGGIDDPDYVLIRIKPTQVQYFDTEHSMSPDLL